MTLSKYFTGVLIASGLALLAGCASLRPSDIELRIERDYRALRANPNSTPISDRVRELPYIRRFKLVACKALSDDACKARYVGSAHSKLQSAYPLAAYSAIIATCNADPVDCTFEALESALVRSHNDELERRRAHSLWATAHPEQAAEAERLRAGRERLAAENARLAIPLPSPTAYECVSISAGDYQSTKCE